MERWEAAAPAETENTGRGGWRGVWRRSGGWRRGLAGAQGGHFRLFPGRRFWHLPGRPPAVFAQPARRRQGSGGARPARPASPSSSSLGWGPGERDEPEPRAPARFPGRADINSFLPAGGRRRPGGRALEPACLHLPLREAPLPSGVRGRLAGAPDEVGPVGPSPSPLHCPPGSSDPGVGEGGEPARDPERPGPPAQLPPGPPPGRGRCSQAGSYRWRPRWAAAPQNTWGPGGGGRRRHGDPARGPGTATLARGPGGGQALAESQARPGVSQKSPCLITHPRARRVR